MKPLSSPGQGKIVRALALFLSGEGKRLTFPADEAAIVVEMIDSQPWTSLTFDGERHHVVLRCPAPVAIDDATFDLPGALIAVERAVWSSTGDGARLAIDLLAVRLPRPAAHDRHGMAAA